MALTVYTTPHTVAEPAAALLHQLGWHSTPLPLSHSKPARSTHAILILHTRPELALAQAMTAGETPEDALNTWQDSLHTALEAFEKQAVPTALVHLPALLSAGPAAIEHIAHYLELPLSDSAEASQDNPAASETRADPGLQVLAAQQVENAGLSDLLTQIEACTLPLGDAPEHHYSLPAPDAEAAMYQWREQKHARVAAEKDHQDARNQVDLLLNQLHQVQEELERQFSENKRLKTEAETRQGELAGSLEKEQKDRAAREQQLAWEKAQLSEQLATAQRAREQLQNQKNDLKQEQQTENARALAELKNTREENEQLLNQLHQVQEELERQFYDNKTLKTGVESAATEQKQVRSALDAAKKAQAEAEQKHESERASLSQELATVRQKLEQAGTQQREQEQQHKAERAEATAELQDIQAENDRLLNQLHLVQEELERHILAGRKRDTDHQGQLERLQAEIAELEQSRNNEQLHHQRLQKELEAMRGSASWKTVRALGKPFRRATPEQKTLQENVRLIRDSGYFDTTWYRETYPDVADSGLDPITHYLKFGAGEGRNPSPEFDTHWYLTHFPDVVEADQNPLVHYLRHGKEEGRPPNAQQQPDTETH